MFKSWDVKIDKEQSRYKRIYRVLGIPMSDGWEKLPKVEYVAVAKRDMSKRLSVGISVVNTSSIGVEFYFVYLFGAKKHIKVEVSKKDSADSALALAHKIAQYLDVKVVDYTVD